jgi:hypothetical protein
MKKQIKQFYGFVVYEIVEGGLLNGLYVNNHKANKGKIMQEIEKRIKFAKNNDDDISGEYNGAWLEIENNERVIGKLKIFKHRNDYTYPLEWEADGKVFMEGTGMKIGSKQFVAIYWKTNEKPITFGKCVNKKNHVC